MRKHLLIFIISLLIFTQYLDSLYAEKIKYFKDYRIDEIDYSIVGEDSLSLDEALKTRCNKFFYDDETKLIRIEGFAYGLHFKDTYEGVYKILFEYKDNDGSITKTFFDIDGNPMRNDKNGVFGERIEKQHNGYQLYFLNKNSEKIENHYHVFSTIFTFDKKYNITTEKYFDQQNNPIRNQLGAYRTQKKLNSRNLPVEILYYDKDNNLCLNRLNYAIYKLKYDDNGEVIAKYYFDERGKPISSYPFKFAKSEKRGDNLSEWLSTDNRGDKVTVYPGGFVDEHLEVNYNQVFDLNTKDFIMNFVSIAAYHSNYFSKDSLNLQFYSDRIDSIVLAYFQNRLRIENLTMQKNKKNTDGYHFALFTTYSKENNTLALPLTKTDTSSARTFLRDLLLIKNEDGFKKLSKYADPATRFCYGLLKTKDCIFYKWEDILFCVSPFNETGKTSLVHKVNIDLSRIPISDDIQHVFIEGVTIDNFNHDTNGRNIKFYFNNCKLKSGDAPRRSSFIFEPSEVTADELIHHVRLAYYFNSCSIDSLSMDLYSTHSNYPIRYLANYEHFFHSSQIKQLKASYINYIARYKVLVPKQPMRNNIGFSQCNIDHLDIAGDYTNLYFHDTKIKSFYGADVDSINQELSLLNSSFESPINFPNISLSDSAQFEMINTSYQAYMRFPWNAIKGKINIHTQKDFLKTTGNLYNLLISNYKAFSLIKDADDCYFTWKQFERKNFWKLYWAEKDHHWYNPFDVAIAIGYTIFHNVNYFSCGYGIKPLCIFPFTIFIVCIFALTYFFMPTRISNLEEHLISKDKIANKLRNMELKDIKKIFKDDDFNFKISKQGLIEDILSSISTDELLEKLQLKPKTKYTWDFFWYCVYFSFSTFTTIGIGDWYPAGKLNKALVMIEGAIGWLCLGLFITTYANILLR